MKHENYKKCGNLRVNPVEMLSHVYSVIIWFFLLECKQLEYFRAYLFIYHLIHMIFQHHE